MERKLDKIENYVAEAIGNIREDRAITSVLLTELMIEMKKNGDLETHKQLGLVASKYVETLQRSNEQLVKVASILKKTHNASEQLDEEDKKQLLDMIQGGVK